MATEPTIRDVLDMLARMREDMATKSDVAKVEANVLSLRAELGNVRTEMRARFDDLGEELSKHSDPTHRDLEARVNALEAASKAAPKRPAPARPRRRT
jgi:arginine/lysine/ornithine decarboxylase